MAKFEIKFIDIFDNKISINVANYKNEDIRIQIIDESDPKTFYSIYLDKATSIKFAKTLRTEINKIQE